MGIVRTVCGDIDAKELGFTLPHEHIFFHPFGKTVVDDWTLTDWSSSVEMLKDFKAHGGGCVVDAAWSPESGREPALLKEASIVTGVHIIAGVGTLGDDAVSEKLKAMSIDELAEHYIHEIEVGMDGTSIKAGWIKGSTHYMYMSEWEEKQLRAACRAAKKTGVAVHTHTTIGTYWQEQLEIVAEEGLPFTQFGIAHIDRNPDYWVHKKICETGAYLIYDGPGKVKYYPDAMRVEILKKLVADGFEKQIMMCNDTGKRDYHKSYGGTVDVGLTYLQRRFLPRLLDEGFSQECLDNFMIHNPARFYSLREKQ